MADFGGGGFEQPANPVYYKHLCVDGDGCPKNTYGAEPVQKPPVPSLILFPGPQLPPPITVGTIPPAPGALYKG